MNKVIQLYRLKGKTREILKLPIGCKLLSVSAISGGLALWAEVNLQEKTFDSYQITTYRSPAILVEGHGEFIGAVHTSYKTFHVYGRQVLESVVC